MITKVSRRTEEKLNLQPRNPYGFFCSGIEVYNGEDDVVEYSGEGWYGLFRPTGETYVVWKRLPREFPGKGDWKEYEEWKRSLGFLESRYFKGEDFFPSEVGSLLDKAGNLQNYDEFETTKIVDCIKRKNFEEAVKLLKQLLQL